MPSNFMNFCYPKDYNEQALYYHKKNDTIFHEIQTI